MIRRRFALPLVVVSLSACAGGGSIRQLAPLEMQTLQAVDSAVAAAEPKVRAAAQTLGELGAEYVEKEFELELSLAKAKRLESMQAPWASPDPDLVATQKAVVLYHLYEVEMAEQRVLEARMAERRAAAQKVLAAYERLGPLLGEAADNMVVLLKYLNQPKSAQITAVANAFFGEVTAFRETLAVSDDPELQALAADVARYEGYAQQAREQASVALDAVMKLGGNDDER